MELKKRHDYTEEWTAFLKGLSSVEFGCAMQRLIGDIQLLLELYGKWCDIDKSLTLSNTTNSYNDFELR
jgi:hypothetical protein